MVYNPATVDYTPPQLSIELESKPLVIFHAIIQACRAFPQSGDIDIERWFELASMLEQ